MSGTNVELSRRALASREGLLRLAAAFLAPARARPAPTVGGTARIPIDECLAWQGTFCSVCRERCPVPGAITATAGRPRVVAEACTGCGLCLEACPAPHLAIAQAPPRHGA